MHDRLTTLERCQWVAGQEDPILRNLLITLSYHDIACAIAERVCAQNVCWTGFAAWASKQAGRFIRLDALPERFGPLAPLLERLDDPVDEMSAHVSEGNRKVYAELAPFFARFIEILDAGCEPAALERFYATFRPGDSAVEGQDRLRAAFEGYVQARAASDSGQRAQWMLLGNAQIGVHEQTRLQVQIERGLLAPIEGIKRLAEEVSMRIGRLKRVVSAASWRFDQLWRTLGTGLTSIALPEGTLLLSRDVPPLPDGRMYPEELVRPTLPPLLQVLVDWDPTPMSTDQSAAADWSDLKERMHYIIDLFRSRQQTPEILSSPFSPAQVAALRRGRRPSGPL